MRRGSAQQCRVIFTIPGFCACGTTVPLLPVPVPVPVDCANAPLKSEGDGGAAFGKNKGGGREDRDGRSRMGSKTARYLHQTCA
jgi:hypothetical protein